MNLPDEVKGNVSRRDFDPPFVMDGRCGHGCENIGGLSCYKWKSGVGDLWEDSTYEVSTAIARWYNKETISCQLPE